MKIVFEKSISDGDNIRTGVTCDHLIHHFPQELIVCNNKSGDHKIIPFVGLRDETKAAMDVYLALLAEDIRDEYENSAATLRTAKKEAEKNKKRLTKLKLSGNLGST